jgi:hypothetical protein
MRSAPFGEPLPAVAANGLGLSLELLDYQAVEQRRVLEPAAIVVLEEVAQHDATGRFIGVDADVPRPLVGHADRAFGKLAADVIRLLVVGAGERLPNLLLARVVVGDRECDQLLQGHAVLGIDVEEFVGDRCERADLPRMVDIPDRGLRPGRDRGRAMCGEKDLRLAGLQFLDQGPLPIGFEPALDFIDERDRRLALVLFRDGERGEPPSRLPSLQAAIARHGDQQSARSSTLWTRLARP